MSDGNNAYAFLAGPGDTLSIAEAKSMGSRRGREIPSEEKAAIMVVVIVSLIICFICAALAYYNIYPIFAIFGIIVVGGMGIILPASALAAVS